MKEEIHPYMFDGHPGSLQTGNIVYFLAEPVLGEAKCPPYIVALKAFRPCLAEFRGLFILNPTPIPSPLIPPLALVPREVIPDLPRPVRNPANDSGAVNFALHTRMK